MSANSSNTNKNIAVLVGSADPDSLNLRVAKAMQLAAPEGLSLFVVPIAHLPFYQPAFDQNPPEMAGELRGAVTVADGVIMISPEYNRSFTAVLKNAIDWLSRPPRQGALVGKPVMIAGATPGNVGTAVAQSHLRSVLPMMGVRLMGTPELYLKLSKADFDRNGVVTTPGTQEFLTSALEQFATFIDQVGAGN